MIDLSVNFAGIKAPNPFWLASAPPTNSGYQIMKAFEAGWGGAVWKTLGVPVVNVSSRYGSIDYRNTKMMGFNNIELITDRPLADNLREIEEVKKYFPDHAVIASLMVESKKEWHQIIKDVENAGADGIELNFGCPHGMCERGMGSAVGQEPEVLKLIVEWVKEAAKIPVIQRRIIRKCIDSKKSVIIATQMLHSMIENPRPTRAEVSDIANAIYNKTDAIMLSGETAYGDYPVEAVRVMTEVAKEVEKELYPDKLDREPRHKEVTSVLARSAVNASQFLPIKAIVTDTLTGRTGRYLSSYRGNVPVYALCYSKRVMRELALSYGVEADYKELLASRDEFVKEAMLTLMGKGYFTSEDSVIILGGSFGPSKGVSFMEISNVYQLTHKV